jgi:aspartate/glutamate racemase
VLGRLTAETALLACTELPLIRLEVERPRLVDVTHLLARALVATAHGSESLATGDA